MKPAVFTLILALLCVFPGVSGAETEKDAFRSTPYPLPRYVSLASDQVYVRAGPGSRYPIQWEFRKKGLPVEIVLEFDTWRKIKDYEGQEGWVHQSLLSGRRTGLIRRRLGPRSATGT